MHADVAVVTVRQQRAQSSRLEMNSQADAWMIVILLFLLLYHMDVNLKTEQRFPSQCSRASLFPVPRSVCVGRVSPPHWLFGYQAEGNPIFTESQWIFKQLEGSCCFRGVPSWFLHRITISQATTPLRQRLQTSRRPSASVEVETPCRAGFIPGEPKPSHLPRHVPLVLLCCRDLVAPAGDGSCCFASFLSSGCEAPYASEAL